MSNLNYTKGEYIVVDMVGSLPLERYSIFCGDDEIARIMLSDKSDAKINADLIVKVVNACQLVNPDNPLAVAESIKDMYEALRRIAFEGDRKDYQYDKHDAIGFVRIAKDALAKVERK
jgi:hypothetical protein